MTRDHEKPLALEVLLFAIGYLALAQLGYSLSFRDYSFATIWPPSGLFLGVLLLNPRSRWPAFAAAAVATNFLFDVGIHGRPAMTSLGYCLSNLTEAVLGAVVVRWIRRPTGRNEAYQFDSMRAVAAFVLGGVLIGPFVASTIGATTVALSFDAPFARSYLHWWIADMLGATIFTPLVLAWSSRSSTKALQSENAGREARWAVAFAVPFLAAIAAISTYPDLRILYLPLPFLMGMAIVSGLRWASLVIVLEMCWFAHLTSVGHGPFVNLRLDMHMALQLYGLVTVFSALLVATLVHERRKQDLRASAEKDERLAVAERLRAVLTAASSTSIIATDARGMIELFSPGAETMLGYAASEMAGKRTPADFHDPDEVMHRGRELSRELGRPIEGFEVFVAKARTGEIETRDWTYIRRDGRRIIVSLSVSALRDTRGEIEGFLGVAVDVTRQRSMVAELVEAREAAVTASRLKSEFLANMSHEIRTPMNGVIGMTSLALETDLTPEQRDYISTVKDSAESLLGVINDVLDFSKIEAGKLTLASQPFDLHELADRLERQFRQRAVEKGLLLRLNFADGAARFVAGDGQRLQQILVNLVGNAVKFTPTGAVSIHLATRPREGADVLIVFTIRDTGIGIPKRFLPNLFDPFTQADTSITRAFGGTGLGLAISKRLVEAMRGTITCESEEGRGTTFVVEIPMGAAEAARADVGVGLVEKAPKRTKTGQRVLLAEDNAVNQKLATVLLERAGLRVTPAERGDVAYQLARDENWDLILMDVQMPGLSGLEATTLIRRHEAATGTARTPIIAMTARALPDDEKSCLAAGMDAYLSKPIEPHLFLQLVSATLKRGTPAPAAPTPAPTATIDLAAALGRAGGDWEVLKSAAQIFLDTWPTYMNDAFAAFDAGNPSRVARALHALNGSAANFFSTESLELGRTLEARCRAGALTPDDREAAARFLSQLKRLASELNALIATKRIT